MNSLSLSQKLQYCKLCTNRKTNLQTGMICGLTEAKPDFAVKCGKFSPDEVAIKQEMAKREARTEVAETGGFFGPEKKGMKKGALGGIIMIAIALIWFFGGLAAGILFYYPPILFLIGLVALIKGLVEGNFAGEKYREQRA